MELLRKDKYYSIGKEEELIKFVKKVAKGKIPYGSEVHVSQKIIDYLEDESKLTELLSSGSLLFAEVGTLLISPLAMYSGIYARAHGYNPTASSFLAIGILSIPTLVDAIYSMYTVEERLSNARGTVKEYLSNLDKYVINIK